jgi:hypothetical protein
MEYNAPFIDPAKHRAADPRIVYADEMLLLERHDSTRGGRTVKFQLPLEGAHHQFADFDGETRFYAVVVRLDDEERPAEETEIARSERKLERAKARGGRHSKFAAIMCKDRTFQTWLLRMGWLQKHWRKQTRREMTAQFICDRCGIESRAELDEKPEAFDRFRDQVEVPYYQWMKEQKK